VDAPESAALAHAAFDRIVEREQHTMQEMRKYSPRAETYLQEFKIDPELGPVVAGDQYYLGRLTFGKTLQQATFHPDQQFLTRILGGVHKRVLPLYGVRFNLSSPGIFIVNVIAPTIPSLSCIVNSQACSLVITSRNPCRLWLVQGRIWVEHQGATL
jgi:hypothetical protein